MITARFMPVAAVACILLIVPAGCHLRLGLQPDKQLLSPEGYATWLAEDTRLHHLFADSRAAYKASDDFNDLQPYRRATQQYIDHGFTLYRPYPHLRQSPPPDLVASLEARTGYLMDVADEFIKHHSTAMGVGLANEIVRDYSDLTVIAPAQRRAHHVLDEYRGRGDYGP